MDSGKLLDIAVKGSALFNSVRKVNKAMSTFRIFSYIALGIAVMLNIFGVIGAIKQ